MPAPASTVLIIKDNRGRVLAEQRDSYRTLVVSRGKLRGDLQVYSLLISGALQKVERQYAVPLERGATGWLKTYSLDHETQSSAAGKSAEPVMTCVLLPLNSLHEPSEHREPSRLPNPSQPALDSSKPVSTKPAQREVPPTTGSGPIDARAESRAKGQRSP